MKPRKIKSITLAVTFCFAFYSICGCSPAKQIANPLDKYDTMPYKEAITVPVKEDVAYKAALLSLEKRGYIVTLSDPQTGLANLELNTSAKLPEDDKQAAMNETGPSAGTIVLAALAVVLVVGIVYLIASSDNDSKEKEKKNNSTEYKKGRIDAGHSNSEPYHASEGSSRRNENWHGDHRFIGPFITPFLETSSEPSPDPSYLYIVTLNTKALSDSTTEISLSTTRMDLIDGDVTNSVHFENKYLNYSVFDAIGNQLDLANSEIK